MSTIDIVCSRDINRKDLRDLQMFLQRLDVDFDISFDDEVKVVINEETFKGSNISDNERVYDGNFNYVGTVYFVASYNKELTYILDGVEYKRQVDITGNMKDSPMGARTSCKRVMYNYIQTLHKDKKLSIYENVFYKFSDKDFKIMEVRS